MTDVQELIAKPGLSVEQGNIFALLQAQGLSMLGWEIDPAISQEKWLELGLLLGSATQCIKWAWVDYWLFGETHKYGEITKLTEEPSYRGPTVSTLHNILSVGRKLGGYRSSRRREDLSFSHHAEVAALEPAEQEAMLAWAAENKAGTKQLRAHVKARGSKPADESKPAKLTATAKQLKEVLDRIEWSDEVIDELKYAIEHKREVPPELRDRAYQVLRRIRDWASSYTEDFRERRRISLEAAE